MKNRIFALALLLSPTPVVAHEVWLDAIGFQVENGADLQAQLKNGQDFVGGALIYNPNSFTRFDVTARDQTIPVEGTIGDRPALRLAVKDDALHIAAYESTTSTVNYKTWDKFQAFADHKSFPDMRARHDARNLPDANFKEAYSRHVKMLACVGTCQGDDRALGLETEIVALKNPYLSDLSGGLPVQLFYQGKPQSERQIEIFARASDGTVTITTRTTDPKGVAMIPMKPDTVYLLDAVTLREPSEALAERTKAVWETLWAALTFQTPAQ